jgi:uncharacterized protein (DUF427 family)
VGVSWQQGPLSPEAIRWFHVSDPLPKLLSVEPIRRRMRVRFGGPWIATTASTPGGPAGISKFTIDAVSSPTPRDRWCSANRDSRRAALDESALTPVEQQTFCRYKGMCPYYDIGDARQAAGSYRHAYASLAVRMSASTIFVAVNAWAHCDRMGLFRASLTTSHSHRLAR